MDKKIEIVRSYSQKVNIGNYQTLDFFCSAKAEVAEDESLEISKSLNAFCRQEVAKSIAEYLATPKVNREELIEKGAKWQKKYNEGSALEEIKVEEEISKE